MGFLKMELYVKLDFVKWKRGWYIFTTPFCDSKFLILNFAVILNIYYSPEVVGVSKGHIFSLTMTDQKALKKNIFCLRHSVFHF